MDRQEKKELLEDLRFKVQEAAELAQQLGRGYREDQINAELTGREGEFVGDGIPDWISELLKELEQINCPSCFEPIDLSECDAPPGVPDEALLEYIGACPHCGVDLATDVS